MIRPQGGGAERRVEIDFAEPQRGVAPGQAAVFYHGTQSARRLLDHRPALTLDKRRERPKGAPQ